MAEDAWLANGDVFSDAERAVLRTIGRTRKYPRNAHVFHEGERSDFVVMVIDGRLKILTSTADGTEAVLGIRGPGSLVGELAALDGGPRTASAIALDPLTVQVLPSAQFREFVTSRPGAALELIRMLMSRLREGDRRRVEFGAYDATARVARLLCDLTREHAVADHRGVDVRLSQHEVAGLVGASRASVARALASLRTLDLVATGRGTITVLDLDALRRIFV
jgi:CRP/FNR family transcriptional regulator, cyclic AMP receptor protein